MSRTRPYISAPLVSVPASRSLGRRIVRLLTILLTRSLAHPSLSKKPWIVRQAYVGAPAPTRQRLDDDVVPNHSYNIMRQSLKSDNGIIAQSAFQPCMSCHGLRHRPSSRIAGEKYRAATCTRMQTNSTSYSTKSFPRRFSKSLISKNLSSYANKCFYTRSVPIDCPGPRHSRDKGQSSPPSTPGSARQPQHALFFLFPSHPIPPHSTEKSAPRYS